MKQESTSSSIKTPTNPPTLKLPFSGEFSPGQVDLIWLLEAAFSCTSVEQLKERIRHKYYLSSCEKYKGSERERQQSKRAGNVIIGMHNYGLLQERSVALTALGSELLSKKEDPKTYFGRFAAHIITNLRGTDVLSAVQSLHSRNEPVTKRSLDSELKRTGFELPQATTKHLVLLNWLRKANILKEKEYGINEHTLAEILGSSPLILGEMDKLTQTERLFLRSVAKLSASAGDWLSVSDAMRYAESLYTLRVPSDQWQARLLKPLEAKGWIELERGTKGRGAKSGRIRGTKKFASDYVKALLEQDAKKLPPELRSGRDRPLMQLLDEMASPDTYKKGLALEFLALRIADFLDLAPKKWRVRSSKTGGAEVDLVIEGSRLVFTRWQVQCKNTSSVHVDDLAKEIGLAVLLKSQVIMIVTTGKIGKSVRGHARKINEETALQVVLIDGQDLKSISENSRASGLALTDLLNAQAGEAMKQKEPQLFEETE